MNSVTVIEPAVYLSHTLNTVWLVGIYISAYLSPFVLSFG